MVLEDESNDGEEGDRSKTEDEDSVEGSHKILILGHRIKTEFGIIDPNEEH